MILLSATETGPSISPERGAGRLSLAALWRNQTPSVLLVVSEVWLLLGSLWMWWWTVEDAFIGYRYAENLAKGFGLVLNHVEKVEGYTDFLWVVLLAGASRMALDPVVLSKVFGTLFNALTLVGCFILCRIVFTEKAPARGIALVLTAASALFVATSVEGLETPLFTVLLSWEMVTYLRGLQAAGRRQAEWLAGSSILSALLMMTRPDGALTYALLWLHAAWRFRAKPGTMVAFTLPAVLLYAPYFLWRWHYYGFFFPNTFYAKGGGTLALYALGALHIGRFLSLQTGGLLAAGLVGSCALLLPCAETTVLSLAVLSRLGFEFWSGGVTAGNSRFLVPALPLVWILTERLFVTWLEPARLGPRRVYLLVGVTALLLASETMEFANFRHVREQEHIGLERAHIALGKWLKQNGAPEAKVAVGDIGAIGFWSGLPILDLDGLADAYIAHQPGLFGRKGSAQYVLAQHPDFVVLRVHRCQPQADDIGGIDLKIYADPEFQNGFERVNCWDFDRDYHLLLFHRRF